MSLVAPAQQDSSTIHTDSGLPGTVHTLTNTSSPSRLPSFRETLGSSTGFF